MGLWERRNEEKLRDDSRSFEIKVSEADKDITTPERKIN